MSKNFGLVEMPAIDTKSKVIVLMDEIEHEQAKQNAKTLQKFITNYNGNFWYRFWRMSLKHAFFPKGINADNAEKYIVEADGYRIFGWKSKYQRYRYNKLKKIKRLCESARVTGKVWLNEYHLDAIENPKYYDINDWR